MTDITHDANSTIPQAVHYDLEAASTKSMELPERPPPKTLKTRHTFSSSEPNFENPAVAPILKRQTTRSKTSHTFRAVDTYPDWHPGQEPGLDPSKPNGGRSTQPTLHAKCEITVVDYSEDDMMMHHLDNDSLPKWLEKEGQKEDWVKCRWINVNGLSWDVIQALGKYKHLHRLALEDLINMRNRTKADWYSDHTFIVLTLQKLVHLHYDSDDSDDEESEKHSQKGVSTLRSRLRKWMTRTFGSGQSMEDKPQTMHNGGAHNPSSDADTVCGPPLENLRTIQRYHGGPNQERMAFMEEKSALTAKNLAVCAEQVSIFVTSDNTVISFFEASAEDVETPILHRLSTSDTILRLSCDASMLTQAIMDAIIDLAMPVITSYQDVIGSLELNVLTSPDLTHTKSLYIVTSEITTMRNFVSPIASLVNALKEHKSQPVQALVLPDKSLHPATGIEISAMARTYFNDVEDHCILIVSALDQMNASAAGMINLIFNTIAAFQNESMKQLTVATIIFLPMTFLTGYFGMNLHTFISLDNDEQFFWSIAGPVAVVVALFLMRNWIWRWVVLTSQRRGIRKNRKGRLVREAAARRHG